MERNDLKTERCFSGTQVGADAPRLALHQLAFAVTAGPDLGVRFTSEAPHASIGSAASCDLRLHDDTVSRHHAEVVVRDDLYLLRDLGSTNGTRVGAVRIVEAYVDPGARVRLGQTELHFLPTPHWLSVGPSRSDRFGDLTSCSPSMKAVFGVLEKVAPTSLTCLIVGETGTGKDMAARALHAASRRAGQPFVVVDCGAVARELVEAELFGHERGAFTGADRARSGAFSLASGGTIFLDEIGELPLELQPKLLRVLERREVKPLGANAPVAVDVRVVAATHRDLPKLVETGSFREDLFYRLSEVVVQLPPLRDRADDIATLAASFLAESASTPAPVLSPDAVEYLRARAWPGNVRELRNAVRRAAVLAGAPSIRRELLESLHVVGPRVASNPRGAEPVDLMAHLPLRDARQHWIDMLEKRYLLALLECHVEDWDAAARHAGLHRKSVTRLLRQHGLLDDE